VRLVRLLFILILSLISITSVSAFCLPLNTPSVELNPTEAALTVGEEFSGNFSLRRDMSGVILGYDFLSGAVEGFSFSENGSFTFTPTETEEISARILFYAVAPGGCTSTAIASYQLLHPPEILFFLPEEERLLVLEGKQRLFSVEVEDGLIGDWLLNDEYVEYGNEFYFVPSFNDAGEHTLVFNVTDSKNLSTIHTWSIAVQNINRPPILIARIPNVEIPVDGGFTFNLSNFFFDPDRTELHFTINHQATPEREFIDYTRVTFTFEGSLVTAHGTVPWRSFITFNATDAGGIHTESNVAVFDVLNKTLPKNPPFCGDTLCISPENCKSCSPDCGQCDSELCEPQWKCPEWGPCTFSKFQYRTCTLLTECAVNVTRPPESQSCDYTATCFDNLQNGNETGVDCGYNCDACPTCDDGVLNQGETNVDCGGLCGACPTCEDEIRNQNESDTDCGGPCVDCTVGLRCNSWEDCFSRACRYETCQLPTCNDGILNQGETNVDCGGSCRACPSCFDSVQNQNEGGVDCGGPCVSCPSCTDERKNQDEKFTDCGGSCKECQLRDYSPLIKVILKWILLSFGALVTLYLLRSIVASRLLFLMKNRKLIHFFYEDDLTYVLLKLWNSFERHFRFRRQRDMLVLTQKAYRELLTMRGAPEPQIRALLIQKLRVLFAKILNLNESFEFEVLVLAVKQAKLPFSIKVILLKNTKLLALLQLTKLYTDAGFALDEAITNLDELRKAF